MAQIKVLFVDDSETDFMLVKKAFEKVKSRDVYILEWAKSYKEGKQKLSEDKHDIYLVDYMLDENTGLDLIADANLSGNFGPFIILTGFDNADFFAQSLDAGTYDYILKGELTPSRILRSVTTALDRQQQEERDMRERQRQKMEALGQLAGGIAHELNNLLQPIMFRAENIIEDTDVEAIKEDAQKILACTQSAAKIIDDILGFSYQDEAEVRVHDLLESAREVLKFSKDVIPKSVELAIENFDSEEAYKAKIDKTDLMRVFMNIMMNAAQAMDYKGRIEIVFKPTNYLCKHSQGERLYGCISIRDNGPGIENIDSKDIFDPFYTTKDVGEGTGLGLSIVYSIVENWGGFIEAENNQDKGACFSIYIPIEQSCVSEKQSTSHAVA